MSVGPKPAIGTIIRFSDGWEAEVTAHTARGFSCKGAAGRDTVPRLGYYSLGHEEIYTDTLEYRTGAWGFTVVKEPSTKESNPRTHKQVLVVRKDLKMRQGKVGAQCSHASMMALLNISQNTGDSIVIPLNADTKPWLDGKFTKVVVYVQSEAELLNVYERAKSTGLISALVTDAGLTEFHGVATNTVVAVGPAEVSRVDAITAGLPLL